MPSPEDSRKSYRRPVFCVMIQLLRLDQTQGDGGDQNHWEFNLPIIGRWEAFPWDEVVDTSLAIGIGPSYASEIPKVEAANTGGGDRLLVYWMVEIEVGPPDQGWSAIFRLHHRSGAFGLVAPEGKSNVLVIGLRQRF